MGGAGPTENHVNLLLPFSTFPLLIRFCMLDLSERIGQWYEEYYLNHPKGDWDCVGSHPARSRWVYGMGKSSSVRNYQYSHYALFCGCSPLWFDDAEARVKERAKQVIWPIITPIGLVYMALVYLQNTMKP